MENTKTTEKVNMTSTARRVAKFHKVSKDQFFSDCADNHWYLAESAYDKLELPKRATTGSAGYDFFAPMNIRLKPGKSVTIPTGICCEMNPDYALFILPRSGLGFKYQMMLSNTLALIDSDYFYSDNEGHIMIKLVNRGDKEINIPAGKGFAQGVFMQYGITVDDDCNGVRNGGFGSTTK